MNLFNIPLIYIIILLFLLINDLVGLRFLFFLTFGANKSIYKNKDYFISTPDLESGSSLFTFKMKIKFNTSFKLSRKKTLNRLLKRLHFLFDSPIENKEFDEMIYVQSNSIEFSKLLRQNDEIRNLTLNLFKGSCHSIEYKFRCLEIKHEKHSDLDCIAHQLLDFATTIEHLNGYIKEDSFNYNYLKASLLKTFISSILIFSTIALATSYF